MPPRRRYPSDRIDYHKRRNPDWAHSVRIPENCADRFFSLKDALGGSMADTVRFIVDAADTAISHVLEARAERVIPDSQGPSVCPEIVSSRQRQPLTDSEHEESGSEDGETDIDDDVIEEAGGQIRDELESEPQVVHDWTLVEDSQVNLPATTSTVEDSQVPLPVATSTLGRQASYGFFSRKCLETFFHKFRVACPVEGCNLFIKGVSIGELQQLWTLQLSCDRGHRIPYLSGELEKNRGTPLITGKFYHSAICSGMSHVSLQSMALELGIHVPRSRHFYDFQAGRGREVGWIQAALDLWECSKREIQDRLVAAGDGVVVYVDCRYDSSRSGFHGTVPFINQADNRIVEMVTLTRREAGNSWRIETAAISKGIELLQGRGVVISEIVHDDNKAVDSLLDGYGILGQKDLWHKTKNVTSKFRELLQEKRKTAGDCAIDSCESAEDLALHSMKDLKEWLRGRGLPVSGNKPELCSRIVAHLNLAEAALPLQRARPYAFPELQSNDMAYKLKSWIYTACHAAAKREDPTAMLLCTDILNASDHWAGLHEICRVLPGSRKCIMPGWDSEQRRYYKPGSPTHLAVTAFLTKHITPVRMKYYRKARENFLSETYHSVINKFATKRIHFDRSHYARLAASALDWNENITRSVMKVYSRTASDTVVRKRSSTARLLETRTAKWKSQISDTLFPM